MLPGSPASSSLFTRSTSSFILKPPGPRPTLVCLPVVTFVAGLMLFPAIDLSIQLVHTWARLIATKRALIRVYQLIFHLNDDHSHQLVSHVAFTPNQFFHSIHHFDLLHEPLDKGVA